MLAILFYATGCRTVKQDIKETNSETTTASEIDYKSMYENQLDVNMQLKQEIADVRAENVKLSSEINTHEIEYDTDKPIDPITNNPPKKKETIQTNRQNSESTVNTATSVQSNLNVDYSFYINQIDDLETRLSAKTKEHEDYKSSIKSRMAVDVWWFWGGIGFLIGILTTRIVTNYANHFSRFVRKLFGKQK